MGDGVDTVAETIALLVSRINDHLVGGDPSYEAAAGTGNTIVLTEDDREAVAEDWIIMAEHGGGAGDISIDEIARTTPGEDDTYTSVDITVTVPTRPGGTADTVVPVTINSSSTNFISKAGDAPSDTTADVTVIEIATALAAATYVGHDDPTYTAGEDNFTLLLSTVGRTAEDYAIDPNIATITQSEGTDADTPANLSIEVTNIDNANLDMDLAADQTDDDIRDDIIAHLQDYPQFSLAEAGQTVVITHNQFGSKPGIGRRSLYSYHGD